MTFSLPEGAMIQLLQNQRAIMKFLARLSPGEFDDAIRNTEKAITHAICEDIRHEIACTSPAMVGAGY